MLNYLAQIKTEVSPVDVVNAAANFYASQQFMPPYVQKYSEILAKAINMGLKSTALPPQPPKVLLTGIPTKSSNPLQFQKKPPIAPPNFMKPPVF